jgi:hypothetical protein
MPLAETNFLSNCKGRLIPILRNIRQGWNYLAQMYDLSNKAILITTKVNQVISTTLRVDSEPYLQK